MHPTRRIFARLVVPAALAAACLGGRALWAGAESVGTTAASFLKLETGARSAALGGAVVALADDASGLSYNPAGMSQMLLGEVQATHVQWFEDLTLESLNGVFPLGSLGVLGSSLDALVTPPMQRTLQIAQTDDPSQNYQGLDTFSPFDLEAAFYYSQALSPDILAGAGFKVLNQDLATQDAFGLAFDFGAIYRTSFPGLQAGFSLDNIGTPIQLQDEAFSLPALARAGISQALFSGRVHALASMDFPFDNNPALALGLEASLADSFFPRIGWRYDSLFNPWSVGLGVNLSPWRVDLCVAPAGDLGLTSRASLSYQFGGPSVSLQADRPALSSAPPAIPALLRPRAPNPDQVTAWALYLYNSRSGIVRRLQGQGALPGELAWDGTLSNGVPAPEGDYKAVLSLRYAQGPVVYSSPLALRVDNRSPQLSLQVEPDSRPANDTSTVFVPAYFMPQVLNAVACPRWTLKIFDGQGGLFRTVSGSQGLPDVISWDGRGDQGQAYVSDRPYTFRFSATDVLGRTSEAPPLTLRAVFRQ